MNDIENLIARLQDEGCLHERAAFSSDTYTSQPILQTGRQLLERQAMEQGQRDRENLREERRREAHSARQRRHGARRRGMQLARAQAEAYGSGRGTDVSRRYSQGDPAHSDDVLDPVPKRYREMRAIGYGGGSRTLSASQAFYEQARFMESYVDDYPREVEFAHYYTTYAVMSDDQLRAYFSWRTKVRRGDVVAAPLSFAFLHAYELLCGIGTLTGVQGYHDLMRFWEAYAPYAQNTTFDAHLRRWTHDYAIYHGIPEVLSRVVRDEAASTLIDAEDAILRRCGRERKIGMPEASGGVPSNGELFAALAHFSRYRVERSRFARDHADDMHAIVSQVFAALVEHCSRRRKTDYVEGLLGTPREEPYSMFPSAVFYDPVPPPDGTVVNVGRFERYRKERGRWWRLSICRREGTSRELGDILRATDSRVRECYGYGYPIKVRKTPPPYVCRIIDSVVKEHVTKQREAEACRITLDLSKLNGIRAAAATTREALLVDDERDAPAISGTNINTIHVGNLVNSKNKKTDIEKSSGIITNKYAIKEIDVCDQEGESSAGLSTTEVAVITALLRGDASGAVSIARAAGVMMSLVIDGINDKLLDVVGDAVVEFDGDVPVMVAEYVEDVREVLGNG